MNANSGRGQFERYRLMVITGWPESELKRAALASAQAALERETRPGAAGKPIVLKAAA